MVVVRMYFASVFNNRRRREMVPFYKELKTKYNSFLTAGTVITV
jgi:hypothetical protein